MDTIQPRIRPSLLQHLLLAMATLAVACGPQQSGSPEGSGPPDETPLAAQRIQYEVVREENALPGPDTEPKVWEGETGDGLQFTLEEANEKPADDADKPPTASPEPLSDEDAAELLGRLPDISTRDDDVKKFAFRKASLKPPLSGSDVMTPFPPEDAFPAPDVDTKSRPLEVARYRPEGKLNNVAPKLSVTFTAPMVPLSSIDVVDSTAVPMTLEPDVGGEWRWLDPRTLQYVPKPRLPMATAFTATIPAGIEATTGEKLKKKFSWEFSTPPPRMLRFGPTGGGQKLRPTIYTEFDQEIDQQALLDVVQVKAGGRNVAVELDKDVNPNKLPISEVGRDGRWVAFVPKKDLPKDTQITITYPKGTPSAEGPLTTEQAQNFSFRTYGPFVVTQDRCRSYECYSGQNSGFNFYLSNPIEDDTFDEEKFEVSPAMDKPFFTHSGNNISLEGTTEPNVTYTVSLPGDLKDIYGQKLTGKRTFKFTMKEPPVYPQLAPTYDRLVVLDPAGPRAYNVMSTNISKLDARLYRVKPENYQRYQDEFVANFYDYYADRRSKASVPGELVKEWVIDVEDKGRDQTTMSRIDISEALDNGLGHAVLIVEPQEKKDNDDYYRSAHSVWIQSTQLGLTAVSDGDGVMGWVTDLTNGTPNKEASIHLAGSVKSKSTPVDANGLAMLDRSDSNNGILIASLGKDTVMLPSVSWQQWRRDTTQMLWYVVNDRQLYRPGESVRIKGWVRGMDLGEGGDIGLLESRFRDLKYKVYDPQGNELHAGDLEPGEMGGFDLKFSLPDNTNLGWGRLEIWVDRDQTGDANIYGDRHYHSFQIQEFRRPEFEVSINTPPGPFVIGDQAVLDVTAGYYSGGPLPDAQTDWYAAANPASYVPPNRGDFQFGTAWPWWMYRSGWHQQTVQQLQGETDMDGVHRVRLDFLKVSPRRPMSVQLNASVTDVNRQRWTASGNVMVHPSELYLGMQPTRSFVEAGDQIEIDTIVSNIEGELVSDRSVELEAVRLAWEREEGSWQQLAHDPQVCKTTSADNIVRCVFETTEGGTYIIRGVVRDGKNRENVTQVAVWVSGGEGPPNRRVDREEAMLLPDKKEYAPGDTAEVLVQAPWYPAHGLLTVRRSGVIQTEVFKMTGPSHTLEIPVEEGHTTGLSVQVDLLGSAPRLNSDDEPDPDLPKRPAFAQGRTQLSVPPYSRTLMVGVSPEDKVAAPGQDTSITVKVRDAKGDPVPGAQVALFAVDESILALTGYSIPDPIPFFYTGRSDDAYVFEVRNQLLLEDPQLVLEQMNRMAAQSAAPPGAMGGAEMDDMAFAAEEAPRKKRAAKGKNKAKEKKDSSGESESEGIDTRSNFSPVAVFRPAATTDENGNVTVDVKLPDNLTRYRVTAVAAAGGQDFGKGEASITARLELMVRPSPPRFLNYGDIFELPVVLQNLSEEPMMVDVAARASNAELTEHKGVRVEVPAMNRLEVRLPARAAMPGTARFQVAAASGEKRSDAAEFKLPVWTPATTEAFAVYGEIDDGAIVQPVEMPESVVTEFGGVQVSTASTAMHSLTDAVLYLVDYPFACTEQVASRVLGVVSLRDVLVEFDVPELPSDDKIAEAMQLDFKKLTQRQNGDGGFPYWSGYSVPYVTIHAAHAMERAKIKKYDVPENVRSRAMRYLENIEDRIRDWEVRVAWRLSEESRAALIAYALYVRSLAGQDVSKKAIKLVDDIGLNKLSLEASAWIMAALARNEKGDDTIAKISRHFANRVEETPGAANFTTGYSDGQYVMLHSNRRTDGVILDALMLAEPDNTLIPKVVKGLQAHRRKGRWHNTQENAFILVAMEQYFSKYESITPDFVARVWLGEQYAGEQKYEGRTTERQHLEIPMAIVAEGDKTKNLILQKDGDGRLYYRIGMKYAPKDLDLDPLERGFTVERSYEAVDDPEDVQKDSDGNWVVRSGATVKVRLKMISTNRRYHVALVDKLPAGLEPLNPALATTGSLEYSEAMADDDDGPWWMRYWFQHQNLRDERVEAFTSLLWEGEYEYTYIARATTPGTFVVPPAKAEEMYSPEVFGRTGTDKMIIK